MTYAFVLRTIVDLYNGLLSFSQTIILWLNTPVSWGSFGSGTIGSILFGGSIGIFLGVMLWKWVKEIIF